MIVPRSVVPGRYPIAPPDDTITAIAPAYGFGSQTAFPQAEPVVQVALGALTVFLATDAAASITGIALPVDGGWMKRERNKIQPRANNRARD
jgi:NAD(P)-dependent dehydrogenase (short-subunit alcohol dehydrogenase family)